MHSKRMVVRLRKRKHDLRGKKVSDGKTIGGKGSITDALKYKLTVYYSKDTQDHSNTFKDIQTTILEIFYEQRSTQEELLHDFFSKGINS